MVFNYSKKFTLVCNLRGSYIIWASTRRKIRISYCRGRLEYFNHRNKNWRERKIINSRQTNTTADQYYDYNRSILLLRTDQFFNRSILQYEVQNQSTDQFFKTTIFSLFFYLNYFVQYQQRFYFQRWFFGRYPVQKLLFKPGNLFGIIGYSKRL